jgi:hypothetical protein
VVWALAATTNVQAFDFPELTAWLNVLLRRARAPPQANDRRALVGASASVRKATSALRRA